MRFREWKRQPRHQLRQCSRRRLPISSLAGTSWTRTGAGAVVNRMCLAVQRMSFRKNCKWRNRCVQSSAASRYPTIRGWRDSRRQYHRMKNPGRTTSCSVLSPVARKLDLHTPTTGSQRPSAGSKATLDPKISGDILSTRYRVYHPCGLWVNRGRLLGASRIEGGVPSSD